MGIFNHQAGGGGFYPYPINQSCRFNDDDTAYLTKAGLATAMKDFTISFWVKPCKVSSDAPQVIWDSSSDVDNRGLIYVLNPSCNIGIYQAFSGDTELDIITPSVFRDISSWYHIVVAVDSAQAVEADRVKIYVNGTQIAYTTSTALAQNTPMRGLDQYWTTAIGRSSYQEAWYLDAYLAEFHFRDGAQLDASYFGETVQGVWVPKRFTGSHSANGWYLDFSNSSDFGSDQSGNANDFTDNGLATNDQVLDSPTNNYCTLNPLDNFSGPTMQEGNLEITHTLPTVWLSAVGTFGVSSGKWYWEGIFESGANVFIAGIVEDSGRSAVAQYFVGGTAKSHGYYVDGKYYNDGSGDAYGAAYSDGDICGVALDMDAGTMTCYKNNASQGVMVTGLSGLYFPVLSVWSNGIPDSCSINCGQLGFTYTPPVGFKALCSANLPEPEILEGNKGFDVVAYTGNGTSQTITGLEFSPDLVWIKNRETTDPHMIQDTVRTAGYNLQSNSTDDEGYSATAWLTAFTSDGFSVGDSDAVNGTPPLSDMIAWNWKEDPRYGFDIVAYTGAAAARAMAHSLGVVPEMIIVKNINTAATNWGVYSKGLNGGTTPENYFLLLNTTAAEAAHITAWNNTAPTSSVFTLGTGFAAADDYIAYLFASVEGFSKVFSYTGNGNADGPFVYCGFRPRFVLFKGISDVHSWYMYDSERDTDNVVGAGQYPDLNLAEGSSSVLDFLSNGWKVRNSGTYINGSAEVYVGIAFAEHPFKYSNAR